MDERTAAKSEFVRILTKLGIGILGLAIIRAIVGALPMLRDAGSVWKGHVTVAAACKMCVDAVLIALLITFALEIRSHLRTQLPSVPEIASLVADLVFLVTIGIAYTDFKPLGSTAEHRSLYIWAFLGLSAVPLVHLLVVFCRNLDPISAALVRSFGRQQDVTPEA